MTAGSVVDQDEPLVGAVGGIEVDVAVGFEPRLGVGFTPTPPWPQDAEVEVHEAEGQSTGGDEGLPAVRAHRRSVEAPVAWRGRVRERGESRLGWPGPAGGRLRGRLWPQRPPSRGAMGVAGAAVTVAAITSLAGSWPCTARRGTCRRSAGSPRGGLRGRSPCAHRGRLPGDCGPSR